MELITTDDFFIFQNVQKGETNLWCCRHTGKFHIRPSWDLAGQENPECLGLVWGIYGKLSIHPDLPERLILVRHCDRIGEFPGRDFQKHSIYKVTSIVSVPILPPDPASQGFLQQLQLKPCPKHHATALQQPNFEPTTSSPQEPTKTNPFGKIGGKIGGSLKSLATDTIKNTAGNAAALASQVKVPWKPRGPVLSKSLERYEKRIIEEVNKLFNGSDSFYFSLTGDITNSLQRQVLQAGRDGPEFWLSNVDERFFFNKSMLQELVDMEDTRSHHWITPFIQGYVEMQDCQLAEIEADGFYSDFQNQAGNNLPNYFTVAVISRRSRHRAGTRYKRRGVDDEGHVANYVETEQVLLYHHYALSFLQVRGSVPVYWSQPGYKYRPPPKLDRSPAEDQQAFARHFNTEFAIYGPPVHCVNLAEKHGRERVITESYLDQALHYNNPDLTFISFDFHDACRGMHFENVSILTNSLEGLLKSQRYTWVDRHGMVCTQSGIFRINCIDCLDRTNVVQTALARLVLTDQLTKLGVVPPEQSLPEETKRVFQTLWANNGDALSRQYAGTNALKGDFTRTGERNLSGMMKDGVNSASRYYLNQFRDAFRQATIDLVTGQIVSETLMGTNAEDFGDEDQEVDEEFDAMKAEQVKIVVDDCMRLLIPELYTVIGAWGLVDGDPVTGDLSQEDMDIILILTNDSYFVANYDDDVDKITRYQSIAFVDIEAIEFGPLEESAFGLSFRKSLPKTEHYLRIHYRMPSQPTVSYNESTGFAEIGHHGTAQSGYFHMFRSANVRFFNDLVFPVKTEEERFESLKSVADSLAFSMEMSGLPIEVSSTKLQKCKSRIPDVHSNYNDMSSSSGSRKPNLSVQAFKGASSKAISSVTSQISRFNPLSKFKPNSSQKDVADVTIPTINLDQRPPDQLEDGHLYDFQIEGNFSCDPSSQVTLSNNIQDSSASDVEVQELTSAGNQLSTLPSTEGRTTPTIILDQPALEMTRKTLRKLPDIPKLMNPSNLSPGLGRRLRNLSRSSEDVSLEGGDDAGILGLELRKQSRVGSSLQKDLNLATQALEDVALESANVAKEVLNPFAKISKGIQNAVLNKKDQSQVCQEGEAISAPTVALPHSASSQSVDYMATKIDDSGSLTKVILL